MSGGYEDDLDEGTWIVYTGQGGNDPNSGRQIADQTLTRGNLALTVNEAEGLPVRVIRGAGHRSKFSPARGLRYDGLYYVDDHWREVGKAGFLIWRFLLRKADVVAPVYLEPVGGEQRAADRKIVQVQRIIRNTVVATRVKHIHRHQCQICAIRLDTAAGPYAEGAHIRPLGRPHNGPDVPANILCMCPNHHLLFDKGAFTVADNFSLLGINGALRVVAKHEVGREYLAYHRKHYFDLRR